MHLQLHLSREQWREIYPHLDPDKLVDPPTPTKLERIGSRVETLAAMMATARELEKFVLMDAVYPLAKEVCIFLKKKFAAMKIAARKIAKNYGVATVSRLLKNVGLFCRISSVL